MADDTQANQPWNEPPEPGLYAKWLASNLEKLCHNLEHTLPPNYDAKKVDAAWLQERITWLLDGYGNPGKCRECGADIVWLQHKSGRRSPYTAKGLNHFGDCPQAKAIRRWEKQKKAK